MRRFELWLDESGDFNNDNQKTGTGANPSLVGGLLIENNTFPDSYINAILPEEGTYHSVNENDQLDRFRIIEEKLFKNLTNRIVVFSNQECIMILDNNLTYLNIISEGILQLIKRLKAQYGEISLKVVIANRVNTTTGLNPAQSVVQSDEYVKRLKEKLLLGSLENSISDKEWTLITASARKDKRLMLADIICNTFFTRYRKKKFNAAERVYIENIYNDENKTLVFTVFESVLEKNFRNNLIENRIGEAVASICLSNNEMALKRCFSLLKLNFSTCGMHDLTFQYKFVAAYIEYYINVVRNFEQCEIFLKNLLQYYIPLLEEYEKPGSASYAKQLALDIKFYLYTVYTHTGNLKIADDLENECDKLMSNLPHSLDTFNYRLKFETRKIANLINAFEFEKALKCIDDQIIKCREVKEILDLVSYDSTSYYDELGKALGTRLQIITFMLRQNINMYEQGKKDSDEAIKEFTNNADVQRQFLYRVQLETEHGDYDQALTYLKHSAGISVSSSIKDLLLTLESGNIFGVNAYIRLMSESKNWAIADEMYKVLSNTGYIQKLEEQVKAYHPVEIILWKYANYCSRHRMVNAAIKFYERSADVCFAEEDITLNVIGIGVLLEEMSVLVVNHKKEITNARKQFQKRWRKTQEADYKGILSNLFGDVNIYSEDEKYLMELSRRITY